MENVTVREAIARNVRAAAGAARARQREMATALGISQQAMSRRLTGEVGFGADELHTLAAFLGVAVDELMTAAPAMPQEATA